MVKSLILLSGLFFYTSAYAEEMKVFSTSDTQTLTEIGSFDSEFNFTFAESTRQVCSWKTVWTGTEYKAMRVCETRPSPPNPGPVKPCRYVNTYDHATGKYVRVRVCG